jgi:NIMA-interacting peptidyl-prolyl cis-trans isomerase 1
MSNSRRKPYFYNKETNQSSWDNPGLTEEEIDSLPGAQLLKQPPGSANLKSVRASHLLVKHRDSRRPSSWKEVRH